MSRGPGTSRSLGSVLGSPLASCSVAVVTPAADFVLGIEQSQ